MITVKCPRRAAIWQHRDLSVNRREIGRVYRKHGFESRVRQLFQNTLSLNLSEHTPTASIDLGRIDACHDTEFVLNDFYKIRDFVRPDGIVLFHDTHPSQNGHLAGSYRACLLLRKAGFDVKWIEDTWWGRELFHREAAIEVPDGSRSLPAWILRHGLRLWRRAAMCLRK